MVPEGWDLTVIEEHIDLLSGFAFKSSGYSIDNDDVRLLRGDNIAPGTLRWANCKRWPKNEMEGLEKYQLQAGDFVIAMDRTWVSAGLKVAAVREDDLPCLLVQRVSRIRAKRSFTQSLLKQIFSTHRFEQYVKGVQTETAVPHISAKQIKEFPVLVPPPEEQTIIANILSTWDKAIEAVEKLIENSRTQKKALMQQLLGGKNRFPDSTGEWQSHELFKLGNSFNGLSGKSKEDFGSGKPFIPYINVFSNEYINTDKFEYVRINERDKQQKVQYGDILFTTSSETPEEVGMSSVLLEKIDDLYLNSFCFGFRLYDFTVLLPEYARYLFRSDAVRRKIVKLAQGSTRYNLSKSALLKLSVKLPSIDEQKESVKILDSASEAIVNFSVQLNHLKEMKKALMQQLLTGKRRVKVESTEAPRA